MKAYQAGKAKGINFSFEDADDYALKFAAVMPDASPSLRLDHVADANLKLMRLTEWSLWSVPR